jgi:hypothetical protein
MPVCCFSGLADPADMEKHLVKTPKLMYLVCLIDLKQGFATGQVPRLTAESIVLSLGSCLKSFLYDLRYFVCQLMHNVFRKELLLQQVEELPAMRILRQVFGHGRGWRSLIHAYTENMTMWWCINL